MPVLTATQIKEKIADGSISAVSIDTNVFDKYGCNLEFAIFRKLNQFKDGDVNVLLSEIVIREVKRHISEQAAETQRSLKKALSAHGKRWKIEGEKMAPTADYRIGDDPDSTADEQVNNFLTVVGAEVIPALGQNDRTAEVLDLYFSSALPFNSKKAKKEEFPDAFALLSLEAYARRHNTIILCVSYDNGWISFCNESDHLVCINDLNDALSFFNDSGRVVAERVVGLLREGAAEDLVSAVESAIEFRLSDTDFHPDGWSSVEFETEPLSATLQTVQWETAAGPVVIAADEDTVTFTTTVSALVSFDASFHFEVRDSVDRDYVSLGSEDVEAEKTIDFELAITAPRDAEEGLEYVEVEVARRRIEVNFGMVEPFQSENPYHEKY